MPAPTPASDSNPAGTQTAPQPPTLSEALRFWLKLGWISFGGPAGQISILHQELVERKGWVSEASFLHALNYCMLLPGPEAQQLATYLGWLMHRTLGGVLAGVLFVLPSLLILIGLSWVYLAWGDVAAVSGIFYGIKPVVAAIVVQAIHRMSLKALKNRVAWAVAGAAFVASYGLHLPFPLIVAVAALVGWLGGHSTTADNAPQVSMAAPPEHTRFNMNRLIKVCIVFALLWLVPMGCLLWQWGWQSTLAQMGWFFTKVALLTFGGAYAVLPYVLDGAVHHYGWLSAAQMMDGLAFGETTPGPLIMVVAFVGFVGAHTHAVLGPEHLWLGAILGACLVTWFTFLPSFFFILAGGPLVEHTRGKPGLVAALGGVTAAVIGAMLHMGLFFAEHILWPSPSASAHPLGLFAGFDWTAALLMTLAIVALLRWKRSVMEVIAAGAVFGLLQTLV